MSTGSVVLLVFAIVAIIACLHPVPTFANPACNKFAAEPSKGGSDFNAGDEAHPYATFRKLASALSAGQTGCVFSGQTIDAKAPQTLRNETHGTEANPITITSTDPSNPATVTSSLALESGSNWINVTHLKFWWEQPPPYTCWNSAGNPTGKACNGEPVNPEDGVQLAISSEHTRWLYDDVQNFGTDICFNLVSFEGSRAYETLIEHDVIHNCGVPFIGAKSVDEEAAWHEHGIYDYGVGTKIFNNYLFGNARNGVLFNGGGSGGIAEHNVIDGNGNGVTFGTTVNDTVQWNIITNNSLDRFGSCVEPIAFIKGCDDFATAANSTSGGVYKHNCSNNNLSGEIEFSTSEPAEMTGVAIAENKLKTNPLYKNPGMHEYSLSSTSPCLGYGPDTAQPHSWSVQAPPNPTGGLAISLNAVSCASSSACVATGGYKKQVKGIGLPLKPLSLAERWNGTEWITLPGPGGTWLGGVSCSSAELCTAVGSTRELESWYNAAATRWNGTGWSAQSTPSLGTHTSELDAVSCSSSSTCNATGSYKNEGTGLTVGLAEQWTGTEWSVQSVPIPSGAKVSQLGGVSCVSSVSCTSVGEFTNSSNVVVPLAESWNGVAWALREPPQPVGAKLTELRGVSCWSTTECTAVGQFVNSTGVSAPLVESWNGTSWAIQESPSPVGTKGSLLSGVSCSSSVSCNAVGEFTNSTNTLVPLAETWTGTAWAVQEPTAPAGATSSRLLSVSCSSPTECVAVGNYTSSSGNQLALAEKYR